MLFPLTGYSQVFQKCVDADGRITYADYCSSSKSVVKAKQIYIPDTYDAEADREAQLNNLALERQTRQSQYERYQRNARYRASVAAISYQSSGKSTDSNKGVTVVGQDLPWWAGGARKQTQRNKLPYGSPGDRAKRESMLEEERLRQNMERAKLGQEMIPAPRKEYWDGKTNRYYDEVSGGVRDRETGRVLEEYAGEYRDSLTGEMIDPMRTR